MRSNGLIDTSVLSLLSSVPIKRARLMNLHSATLLRSYLQCPLHQPIVRVTTQGRILGWALAHKSRLDSGKCVHCCFKNGAMLKELTLRLIDHFYRHAREIVPPGVPGCLKLDGCSSRHGWDCLVSCCEKNIELIQGRQTPRHFATLRFSY